MESQRAMSGAIPAGDLTGLSVLDVGCSDGWRFDLPEFARATRLIGIEPSGDALQGGEARRFRVEFHQGVAESLPLADSDIDVYMSIVSLPYSDIPRALAEAHRVLRPGGRLHITMHDLPMQWKWFWKACRSFALKRVIDHVYIVANSACLWLTGRCFSRPWKRGTYESFQTRGRMMSLVQKAGFIDVRFRRTHHFVIEASKR